MEETIIRRTHAASTLKEYDQLRRRTRATPRLRLAIRFHVTGAAKTKREAALMAGLAPVSFYRATMPSINNAKASSLYAGLDELIDDRAVDMTVLMEKLSEEALRHTARLMVHSGKDEVQLAAARELLDRGRKTAKVTQLSIATDGLTSEDAKVLASALVEAAMVRKGSGEAAVGDYVKVDIDNPVDVKGLLGSGIANES